MGPGRVPYGDGIRQGAGRLSYEVEIGMLGRKGWQEKRSRPVVTRRVYIYGERVFGRCMMGIQAARD